MGWYADPALILASYLFAWAGTLLALGLGAAVVLSLIGMVVGLTRARRVGDEYVSNCVAFAVGRRLTHGGRIVVRRSKLWWGPHFLWQPPDGGPVQQFVPLDPDGWWLVVFRGRVAVGDPPEPCVPRT
mgnify:FL=1